jgi:hypothetical protein
MFFVCGKSDFPAERTSLIQEASLSLPDIELRGCHHRRPAVLSPVITTRAIRTVVRMSAPTVRLSKLTGWKAVRGGSD